MIVGDAGVPARVDGSKLEWRVDPDTLGLPFTGRTALLSPFDRLIHDRVRAEDLLDFTYVLEMYKPAANRPAGLGYASRARERLVPRFRSGFGRLLRLAHARQ